MARRFGSRGPRWRGETVERVSSPPRAPASSTPWQSRPQLNPRPDNIILLTDGLPTVGNNPRVPPRCPPRQRAKLFNRAVEQLPSGIPVNIILFPMEGDPLAASAFWKLAIGTRGSFMSLSEDWP